MWTCSSPQFPCCYPYIFRELHSGQYKKRVLPAGWWSGYSIYIQIWLLWARARASGRREALSGKRSIPLHTILFKYGIPGLVGKIFSWPSCLKKLYQVCLILDRGWGDGSHIRNFDKWLWKWCTGPLLVLPDNLHKCTFHQFTFQDYFIISRTTSNQAWTSDHLETSFLTRVTKVPMNTYGALFPWECLLSLLDVVIKSSGL